MDTPLRALLFDFDGTIAETERFGHRVAYNRAFAQLGLDWDWDEKLYGELLAVAGGKERVRHFIERHGPRLPPDADPQRLAEEIHQVKAEHFTALAPAIPLRPGVLRLAREARDAGIAIGIVTTAAEAGVAAVLNAHPEFGASIGLIAAGDVVARKKPAPDIYRWALERLALAARDCLAVEDSAVGLQAALAAGVPAIVTVSDYSAGETFAGAAAVFSSLGDPGVPAHALQGPEPAAGVVDLDLLRRLTSGTACNRGGS
jgi:HAD superfamily hydrolase (TIGR01509 family)